MTIEEMPRVGRREMSESAGGKARCKSATHEQGSRDATDPLIHIEPACTPQFASVGSHHLNC